MLLLLLAAGPATRPGGAPLAAGRDTPAGAMNVFEKAIDDGDVATAADSFYVSPDADPDGSFCRARVAQCIAMRRFDHVVHVHFSPTDAATILRQCRIATPPPSRPFTDADWVLIPGETGYARGRIQPDFSVPESRYMTRCPDGIWRMGTGRGSAQGLAQLAARANALSAQLDPLTQGIESGRYKTADAVIHACWPNGTPAERLAQRRIEMQQQQAQQNARDLAMLPLELPGAFAWAWAEKNAEQQQAADQAQRWRPSKPTAQTIAAAQPLASPATRPAVARRDTPAGAMRFYEDALDNRDVASVADSLIAAAPMDDQLRHGLALQAIAQRRFYRTVENWFGRDEAVHVCFYCEIPTPPSSIADADWQPMWGRSNFMGGAIRPSSPMMLDFEQWPSMRRGPDGLWRVDEGLMRFGPGQEGTDDLISTAAHLNEVAAAVDAGQLRNEGDVIHAVQYRADVPFQPPPALPRRSADPETAEGVHYAFIQAVENRDAAAVAKLFHADGDTTGRLGRANAQRIVAVYRLQDAIDARFPRYGTLLVARFGLLTKADRLEWNGGLASRDDPNDAIDAATGRHYRNIGGTEIVDITPAPTRTVTEVAADMEHDNRAAGQIMTDVSSGKYKTPAQVRDAMLAAHFSAAAEPDFVSAGYKMPGED
jgi:hypothetical protein